MFRYNKSDNTGGGGGEIEKGGRSLLTVVHKNSYREKPVRRSTERDTPDILAYGEPYVCLEDST